MRQRVAWQKATILRTYYYLHFQERDEDGSSRLLQNVGIYVYISTKIP